MYIISLPSTIIEAKSKDIVNKSETNAKAEFELVETKDAKEATMLGMIQQIIDDAEAMEAESIRSKGDAQNAYEDFVKETNASTEVVDIIISRVRYG